jgi:hypothetical protein
MMVSWTQIVVLFDLGAAETTGKAMAKIATMPLPPGGNGKNPCSGPLSNQTEISTLTGSSLAVACSPHLTTA